MAFNITHEVRPQQTTAKTRIGWSRRYGLMPHAIITTNSRSAESRPRPTSRPMSSDIGMVSASACGNRVTVSCRIVAAGTPFAIISSASSMMKGIIRMKVNTSSASRNGGMISRITYRSMMRGMPVSYYQPVAPPGAGQA